MSTWLNPFLRGYRDPHLPRGYGRDPSLSGDYARNPSLPDGVIARFVDVSLIGVPFLVGTRLGRGAGMALAGKAIKRHATEDNLC